MGTFIEELYIKQGFTQSQIAEKLGIDKSTISRRMTALGIKVRPGIRLGKLNSKLAPTEKVANSDFYWAAGFYEGEGYTCRLENSRSKSKRLSSKYLWSSIT